MGDSRWFRAGKKLWLTINMSMQCSPESDAQVLYYLPGHGGRITHGLGQALVDRGYQVVGRETLGDFKKLGFRDQVKTIANDLKAHFWREEAKIVANSFGAYLLLHALSTLDPYMGKMLLLSPIVGEFSSEEINIGFIPPHADRLKELAGAKLFPIPKNCSIHVGSEDWQSNPNNVRAFAEALSLKANIVPNAGHQLPKEYVSALLDEF
jgi:pimeloyl-ACP methyl ester carboxylesterase